jgi:hypothetical protein
LNSAMFWIEGSLPAARNTLIIQIPPSSRASAFPGHKHREGHDDA